MSSIEISDQSIVPYPLDHVGFTFKLGKLVARQIFSIPCYIYRYYSSCNSLDDSPTLPALQHFPVKNGHIDIAREIGPDYEKFGTLLLEDKNGVEVKNIKLYKRDHPVHITVEILHEWLQGKGRMPVTWQTLVECLRDIDLNVLADKIDHSLSKQEL